jgi:hypothetical protein
MNTESLLDHFVYVVPALAAGSGALGEALGLVPTDGGAHPHSGTANSLLSLGTKQYLEVLGPNAKLARDRLAGLGAYIAGLAEPDVLTFAMGSRNLDAVARTAAELGLATTALETNSRRTPAGDLLQWRGMHLRSPEYRGLVPFFIDWLDSRHPAETSAQGAELASMYVAHPVPAPLRTLYARLGIRIPVVHGSRPGIVATLRHGSREFVLLGSGCGLPG